MNLKADPSKFYTPTLFRGDTFIYPTNTPESNNYGPVDVPLPLNYRQQSTFLVAVINNNTYYAGDLFIDRAGGTSFALWTYQHDVVPINKQTVTFRCYHGSDGEPYIPYALLDN